LPTAGLPTGDVLAQRLLRDLGLAQDRDVVGRSERLERRVECLIGDDRVHGRPDGPQVALRGVALGGIRERRLRHDVDLCAARDHLRGVEHDGVGVLALHGHGGVQRDDVGVDPALLHQFEDAGGEPDHLLGQVGIGEPCGARERVHERLAGAALGGDADHATAQVGGGADGVVGGGHDPQRRLLRRLADGGDRGAALADRDHHLGVTDPGDQGAAGDDGLNGLRAAPRHLELHVEALAGEVAALLGDDLRSERQALDGQDVEERDGRGAAGSVRSGFRSSAAGEQQGQARGQRGECPAESVVGGVGHAHREPTL
jgi:hypothetical protein